METHPVRHDPEQRAEKIAGLVERWRAGEFSEVVFTASLVAIAQRKDQIDELLQKHRSAFRQSLPYLRGDVR